MKKNNSLLLSAPYVVWMLLFTLIPLGVVAVYALTDPSTQEFSLVNIKNLGMFLPTIGTSVWYALISSLICLVLGYPVAYYIAHRGPVAQKILYMLVMLPMCISCLWYRYWCYHAGLYIPLTLLKNLLNLSVIISFAFLRASSFVRNMRDSGTP